MENKDTVIYKPLYTPNQNWVKELDPRQMDSSFSSFKAPENDKRVMIFYLLVNMIMSIRLKTKHILRSNLKKNLKMAS